MASDTHLIQELSRSDLSSVDLSIFFESEVVNKEEVVVLAEGAPKSPAPPFPTTISPPIIEDPPSKSDEQNVSQGAHNSNDGKETSKDTSVENEYYKSDDEIDVLKETYQFDVRFKETEDYKIIIETIQTLRKQRRQAKKDLITLENEKKKALEDPGLFVEELVYKRDDKLPKRQNICKVPKIDLDKYAHLSNISKSRESREGTLRDGDVVRGRVYTAQKPPSFNRLWTPEEQRKLERLLIEYPEEAVASHRWEKIARALGNRSPKQVASRVQKYFIKLAKAGLPVPGKVPNLETYSKKKIKSEGKRPSPSVDLTDPTVVTIHTRDLDYYVPPVVPMAENDDDDDEQTVSEDNERRCHSEKTLPGCKQHKLTEEPQIFRAVKSESATVSSESDITEVLTSFANVHGVLSTSSNDTTNSVAETATETTASSTDTKTTAYAHVDTHNTTENGSHCAQRLLSSRQPNGDATTRVEGIKRKRGRPRKNATAQQTDALLSSAPKSAANQTQTTRTTTEERNDVYYWNYVRIFDSD